MKAPKSNNDSVAFVSRFRSKRNARKCFAGRANAIKLSKSLEGFEDDVTFSAACSGACRAHEYLIPGSGESNVNSVRKPTAERTGTNREMQRI